jgi:hypothetical protein
VRLHRALWLLGPLLGAGLIWALTPADALTRCGAVPAIGVAYRVGATHVRLHMTAHFQDAQGDHQDATLTADWRMRGQPPIGPGEFGIFGACPGKKPLHPPYWFSSVGGSPRLTISASWYDTGNDAGTAPFSGSCQGSFVYELGLDSAWRADLDTSQGITTIGRHPTQAVSGYVNVGPSGACSTDNLEIAADAIQGGLDSAHTAPIRLPTAALMREGRTAKIPVGVSWSGRVGQYGIKEGDPGAVSTVSISWQGTITLRRAYTCTPNGCGLPNQY